MTRTNLIATLKASLHDAARVLNAAADADWNRVVDNALQALSLPDGKPLLTRTSIELIAGQREYSAPVDLVNVRSPAEWGLQSRQDLNPWEAGFLHKPLFFRVINSDTGRQLQINRTITAGELSAHGTTCFFTYYALHSVTDLLSTVPDTDMLILLTRCQLEAVHELMLRNYTEPVGVMGGRDDINGSPQQVYQMLLGRYYGMCRA
jgi:hypothetical protein